MARRALPALLALIALVADLAGAHGVALAFVLASIPAAFALALECYGDALEARCGGLRPLLAGGGLVLLVLSAALRSPAVVGGGPPPPPSGGRRWFFPVFPRVVSARSPAPAPRGAN